MDKDKKSSLDFFDTDDYEVGAFGGRNDFGNNSYGFEGSQSQTQDFHTQSQFTQPGHDFTQSEYASQSQVDQPDSSSSSSVSFQICCTILTSFKQNILIMLRGMDLLIG